MSYGRLVAAAVVALIVFFAYGFLVNGLLIRNEYSPYTGVYRAKDAVSDYMPLGFAGTFVGMLALAMIYAKFSAGGGGAAEGARLGVLIGIFSACTHVIDNYVTLNIGGRLAAELAVASFLQWVAVCVAIGLVYRPARAAP
jgi:hypothetical protein